MLGKQVNQEQTQSQSITIAQQEHGLIETVHCAHYGTYPMENAVEIMIYHGKVTRVFCKYYQSDLCMSPFHHGGIKICNIKREF